MEIAPGGAGHPCLRRGPRRLRAAGTDPGGGQRGPHGGFRRAAGCPAGLEVLRRESVGQGAPARNPVRGEGGGVWARTPLGTRRRGHVPRRAAAPHLLESFESMEPGGNRARTETSRPADARSGYSSHLLNILSWVWPVDRDVLLDPQRLWSGCPAGSSSAPSVASGIRADLGLDGLRLLVVRMNIWNWATLLACPSILLGAPSEVFCLPLHVHRPLCLGPVGDES